MEERKREGEGCMNRSRGNGIKSTYNHLLRLLAHAHFLHDLCVGVLSVDVPRYHIAVSYLSPLSLSF